MCEYCETKNSKSEIAGKEFCEYIVKICEV